MLVFFKLIKKKLRFFLIESSSFFFSFYMHSMSKFDKYSGDNLPKNIFFILLTKNTKLIIGFFFNCFLLTDPLLFKKTLLFIWIQYLLVTLFIYVFNLVLKKLGLSIMVTGFVIFLMLGLLWTIHKKIKTKKKISKIIWTKAPYFYKDLIRKITSFNMAIDVLKSKTSSFLPNVECILSDDFNK